MADDDTVLDDSAIDPVLEKARQELLAKAKKDGRIDQHDIFVKIPDTQVNVRQSKTQTSLFIRNYVKLDE